MESLKKYSMNISEDAYHAYPAWSYSMISRYAKEGFSAIATLHEHTKPTEAMRFGSLFDSILTRGKKTLDTYAVMDMSIPEAERNALDYISDCSTGQFVDLDKEYIYEKCQECGYYPKWGVDAKYKHLLPYKDYYDMKKSGKEIVSRDDWDEAMEMAQVFRQDPYLKTIFGTKNTEEVEYVYQAQFCVDMTLDDNRTVKMKIMPDLLVVNHKDKTIQPVDLKTSAMPAFDFYENFLKLRYDLQAEVYTDVLKVLIARIESYRDYTVLDYLFSDISRSDKVPSTYYYDPSNGFSFTKNDRTYRFDGWQKLLKEILDYEETQAKVPNYISTTGPNDIIKILERNAWK